MHAEVCFRTVASHDSVKDAAALQASAFWDFIGDHELCSDIGVGDVVRSCRTLLLSFAQNADGLSDSMIGAACVQLFQRLPARKMGLPQQAVAWTIISPDRLPVVLRALMLHTGMKSKGAQAPCCKILQHVGRQQGSSSKRILLQTRVAKTLPVTHACSKTVGARLRDTLCWRSCYLPQHIYLPSCLAFQTRQA
jgi:hypothetical protein